MAEQEKKPAIAARRKNHQFGNRAEQSGQKSTYKSKVIGLEEAMFDVGALSDPAKFSKSLKSIKNYIKKTYKMPDEIVKAIQQMKRPMLPYPDKPTKAQCVDDQGDFDKDELVRSLYGLISRCRFCPHCRPPKFGWYFLPKLVFKKKHSLEEREIGCS